MTQNINLIQAQELFTKLNQLADTDNIFLETPDVPKPDVEDDDEE